MRDSVLGRRAASLVEVMIAVVILLGSTLLLIGLTVRGRQTVHSSGNRVRASSFARAEMERLLEVNRAGLLTPVGREPSPPSLRESGDPFWSPEGVRAWRTHEVEALPPPHKGLRIRVQVGWEEGARRPVEELVTWVVPTLSVKL